MSARILSGQYFNLLSRGVVSSSALDPLYLPPGGPGLPGLADGKQSKLLKFGTFAGGENVVVDGNLFQNSSFEQATGGIPTFWTPTGTVAQVSSASQSGTYSCQLTGSGSSIAQITQLVESGDKVQVDCWAEITAGGVGATVSFYLQNIYTKNWWNGSAWQAGQVAFATVTAGTWTPALSQVPVESFAACGGDVTALQLTAALSGGTSPVALVDDCYIYPAVDTCFIGGHSIDPGVNPVLKTAANAGAGAPTFSTTQLTLGNLQPSFYGILGAPVYSRWWQLSLPVANVAEAGIAELVLGLSKVLLQTQDYDWDIGPLHDMVDLAARSGEPYTYPYSVFERRLVTLLFTFAKGGLPAFAQVRDELDRRSKGKGMPLLLIPDDTDPAIAVLCRQTTKWKAKRTLNALWKGVSLAFEEVPFPGSGQ